MSQSSSSVSAPNTTPASGGDTGGRAAADSARITARLQPRHIIVALSFVVLVVVPTVTTAWYMWSRATDRYVSSTSFSIRTEDTSSAMELLGGMVGMSSSSSDTDILYDFMDSPEIVRAVDEALDLRTLWSKADPAVDPVFAFRPGTIEDLVDYWQRMVGIYYDTGTGIIELQVQAFTPDDARLIAERIFSESSDMINRLSAIARTDATAFARDELETAVERLKVARAALTRFRNEAQIVDPSASIQSQMGILSSLQAQLTQTLIDLDLLRQNASSDDPRVQQGERRIAVIEARIAEERAKMGMGAGQGADAQGGTLFVDLVGTYEGLMVDQHFAETAYTTALAAYDAAVAEARRQSRYIAAHVNPTLPERATLPNRFEWTGLMALFSFLLWAVLVLMGYALRDRR